MKLRMRPLTLLSGSLLLVGLAACTGEPPAVGYGPGKAEVDANKAAAVAANTVQGPAHGQPGHVCTPGQPGCSPTQAQAHGQPAHGQPAAANQLPKDPSPSIKYDAPFDGTPVASTVDADGIAIDDFVIGEGVEASKGASVVVHYTGYLTDGTVFDTSLKRGRPFPFDLGGGRVIKGWDKGIVGMRVGGKRRLVIPTELGYGARAAGKIPPNSTLIFTVELVSMTPPLPPPQPLTAFAGEPLKTDKRADGLIISDYRIGTGAEAREGDELKVHYQGTLQDGTEFDSSHPRAKPISFALGRGRVIKGWDQGILGMKVGGLRKLVIPAELAYGERARGKIPANAELTFLVELMDAKPALPAPVRPQLGGKPGQGHPGAHGQPGHGHPGGHAQPGRPTTGEPGTSAKPAKPGTAATPTASADGGNTGTKPADGAAKTAPIQ